MFISVNQKKRFYYHALYYTLAAAFTGLFAAVYEIFSHEVYSVYMIGAFLIPLLLGALPAVLIASAARHFPGKETCRLWAWGLSALTIGALFQGALEIYGTTNRLIAAYPAAGALLLIAALISLPFFLKNRDGSKTPFDAEGNLIEYRIPYGKLQENQV